MARVTPQEYLEIRAAADACGMTVSQMLRELLDRNMGDLKKRAEETALAHAKLPHGVTPSDVDTAADRLSASFVSDGGIMLRSRDLWGPRGKATYRLLQAIWEDKEPARKEVVDKFIDAVANKFAAAFEPTGPERIRSNRKRNSD
jgi:hypothetical protein